jgi:hypothetical protein
MSYDSQHTKCLVCGFPAYELQLCREHLDGYQEWKKEYYGEATTTNRVDEFVDYYNKY